MSYDDALKALSIDALRFVKDGDTIGLGSGRAASTFVRALGGKIHNDGITVRGIPTSLQIRLIAEDAGIPLIESGQVDVIDTVFDGADQIDSTSNMIKGGGGALLREKILISLARKVIIMADKTKFVKKLDKAVPVEFHTGSRAYVASQITSMGGKPILRLDAKKYPAFTENGNLIFDCDFGIIESPAALGRRLRLVSGVVESGLFTKKPSMVYRASLGGRYDVVWG